MGPGNEARNETTLHKAQETCGEYEHCIIDKNTTVQVSVDPCG